MESKTASKRICKFCLVIKPQRAHHCRFCRQCVLKYDHHCWFVSNCIGFYNYKYFFNLIVYSLLLLLFILITSIDGLYFYLNLYGFESLDCKIFVIFYCLIFLIFLSLLDLFIFHFNIILKGLTTVEKKSNLEESEKNCKSNMNENFGHNFWFCPISKIQLNFRTKVKVWRLF